MKVKRFGLVVLAAISICGVSLSGYVADVRAQGAPERSSNTPIKVYEPGAIAPGSYTVIDRLWVSRWRTVFDVPRYADAESAVRAFLNEAERAGGDGVVNMNCLQSSGTVERWGGHYCYGSVIKLK
jgi:hypothetical protein